MIATTKDRQSNGRFAPGNAGGPGRPRRAVEADYLRVLAEECPIEVWREICRAAVERARAADPKALAWLARYLLGPNPTGLLDLAATEAAGLGGEEAIRHRAREKRQQHERAEVFGSLASGRQADD